MTNAAYVAIACGIIVGLGALGASIGIALMGGKSWKVPPASPN